MKFFRVTIVNYPKVVGSVHSSLKYPAIDWCQGVIHIQAIQYSHMKSYLGMSRLTLR